MGVSLQQAEDWERLESHTDPIRVYFATERTKSWETRLKEYRKRVAAVAGDETDEFQVEIRRRRRERIGTEFHGFMSLPRELRDMIYKYILIKSLVLVSQGPHNPRGARSISCHKFWNSFRYYYPRYRGLNTEDQKPAGPIGLICGVSWKVHGEAVAVFYGCNRFVFPCDARSLPLTPNFSGITSGEVYDRYISLYFPAVRDVSYTFDMRGIAFSPYPRSSLILADPSLGDEPDPGPLDPARYMMALHDQARVDLLVSWNSNIFSSLKKLHLDRLELSFEECYCPIGCCRLVGNVLRMLSTTDFSKGPPKIIEITGWINEDEKEWIRKPLENLGGKEDSVEVRFIGRSLKEFTSLRGLQGRGDGIVWFQ
ncbi:hypothetical protein F4774DRAFT_65317 [Daldinia eschscholtzii]|nr:hypothetical protein F4774DRAFT_65317 [Daldinia eschscholtzii]